MANTKELSVEEKLRAIYALQLIDSKIDLGELIEICTVPVFEDDNYIDIFMRTQNYELKSLISVLHKLRGGEFKAYSLRRGKYNKTMNHDNEDAVMEKFNWYKNQYSSIRKTYVETHLQLPWMNLEN